MIFSYKCQYEFYFTNWLNYIHIIRESTGEMIIRVEEFKSNVCELSEELFDHENHENNVWRKFD